MTERGCRIAAVENGSGYHRDAFERPPVAGFFDAVLSQNDLTDDALADVDALVVACRSNGRSLAERRDVVERFLAQGKYVFAMGETRPDLWLAGVGFEGFRITQSWWWLTPGATLGIQVTKPESPLLAGMTAADLTWHLHGFLTATPSGVDTLVVDAEGRPIVIDGPYGGGRLFVTTLDPFYRHGRWFMPMATTFLAKLLPNLRLVAADYANSRRKHARFGDPLRASVLGH